MLDGQRQRVDLPRLCQNCSERPPAEKSEGGYLSRSPSRLPDDPIGGGTELNTVLDGQLVESRETTEQLVRLAGNATIANDLCFEGTAEVLRILMHYLLGEGGGATHLTPSTSWWSKVQKKTVVNGLA